MDQMVDRGLTPTRAEELWLWRRRQGVSQGEAARLLRVGRTTYWRMETGRVEPADRGWRPIQALTREEVLALARRRSGLGLRRAAKKVGVSHVTFLAMERRADPVLFEIWGLQAFTAGA